LSDSIPKKFAVIGMGTFGYSLVKELSKRGFEVIAIDFDEEKVKDVAEVATHAFAIDATDEKALKDAGIQDVDVAIVSVGPSISTSLLITLLLKEIGVKNVVVKVLDELHAKLVKKIGADRIMFPERDMAVKFVQSIVSPDIFEMLELSEDYKVAEIAVPSSFVNKTLATLDIRKRYNLHIIAIKRSLPVLRKNGLADIKSTVEMAPGGDDELREGDVLVVIGKKKDIEKLRKL